MVAPEALCVTIERVVALLEGHPVDLSDIVLDMTGVPPFHQGSMQWRAACRRAPP